MVGATAAVVVPILTQTSRELDIDSRLVEPDLERFLTPSVYRYLEATVSASMRVYDPAKLDYVHEAIGELALQWDRIVAKYDATKTGFIHFVGIELAYIARRKLAYTRKKISSSKTEPIYEESASVEPDYATELHNQDCQAMAKGLLKHLDNTASWIVWNHARGFTFEDIAISLKLSRNTVQGIYKGAIEKLRRLSTEQALATRLR
jgi:DNA-directed RNA polymerase specialized sigma24 family protein